MEIGRGWGTKVTGFPDRLVAMTARPIAQCSNSSPSSTPITDATLASAKGASVVAGLQAPIPSAVSIAVTTTESIPTFVLGAIPGTVSTMNMKKR
jgi:hypothetical protein